MLHVIADNTRNSDVGVGILQLQQKEDRYAFHVVWFPNRPQDERILLAMRKIHEQRARNHFHPTTPIQLLKEPGADAHFLRFVGDRQACQILCRALSSVHNMSVEGMRPPAHAQWARVKAEVLVDFYFESE